MGVITSQSRFTETYPIPAEIISSLKFLDSLEANFSFCFCTIVASRFFVFPISAKTLQARTRGWLLPKEKHKDLFGDEIHVAQNFHQEVTGTKHNKK